MKPGELIKAARRRRGLSQARLALRAGTTQSAISRIERGLESPTVDRLEELLLVMGERLVLEAEPPGPEADSAELRWARELSPEERLREAASWNLVTTQLEIAGAKARRAGHPATRRRDEA